MKEILKVEGMSCGHCVNSIETNVGELAGVSAVKVDLANKEVAVEYDNAATLAQIKETIEDQGYDLV
ncbi:copper chaperone CopZ [Sporosarcina sp. FSL K6-1522]|uniref:copper chaperone CopZ n=1 Tax=Sporosarcina sp. FSL K6-1522 TaxID=2921554 RepID=UPI00315A1E9B